MRPIYLIAMAIIAGMFATCAHCQQRIFRASPIDQQQNQRLDAHDQELNHIKGSLANIELAIKALPTAPPIDTNRPAKSSIAPPIDSNRPAERSATLAIDSNRPAERSATLAAKESNPIVAPALVKAVYPQASGPQRYTRAELEQIVRSRYPTGFRVRHADVNPRSAVWNHLKSGVHGFSPSQVDGMDQSIALGLHDMQHGGEITPYRRAGVSVSQATRQPAPMRVSYAPPTQYAAPPRPIVQYQQPAVQYVGGLGGSGCANGSCARPTNGMVYRSRSVSRVRR